MKSYLKEARRGSFNFPGGTHSFIPVTDVEDGEVNVAVEDNILTVRIKSRYPGFVFNTVETISGLGGLTSEEGDIVIENTDVVNIAQ